MKTFQEFLEEAVVSDLSKKRYEFANGKKPSGHGNWLFTKHEKGVEPHHKLGEDHTQHQGTFSEASAHAKKWAKSKGISEVHVAT